MIFLNLMFCSELEYSDLIFQKMYLITFSGIKQFYKGVPFHPLPHKIFEGKVCKLLSFTRHNSCRTMKLMWISLKLGESSNNSVIVVILLNCFLQVCELLKLLSSLPFHQCLVFSNYQIRYCSLCMPFFTVI